MNKSVREYTFYGTVSVKKKVAITTYSDNDEIAYEKAMDHLMKNVENIDDYIIDDDGEFEVDIDEVESKLLHECW